MSTYIKLSKAVSNLENYQVLNISLIGHFFWKKEHYKFHHPLSKPVFKCFESK